MFSYQFIMQLQILLQHKTKSGSGISRSPLGHLPRSAYAIEIRAYAHRSLEKPRSPSACSSMARLPPFAEIAAAWLSGYTQCKPSVSGISCGKFDEIQPTFSPRAFASIALSYTLSAIFARTFFAGSFSGASFISSAIFPPLRNNKSQNPSSPPFKWRRRAQTVLSSLGSRSMRLPARAELRRSPPFKLRAESIDRRESYLRSPCLAMPASSSSLISASV